MNTLNSNQMNTLNSNQFSDLPERVARLEERSNAVDRRIDDSNATTAERLRSLEQANIRLEDHVSRTNNRMLYLVTGAYALSITAGTALIVMLMQILSNQNGG